MADKNSPSRLARFAFVAAAIGFLVLAGYSLWLDRSATAAVAGALAFAFLLLNQLPYLESMEVLTLKVKLRERLSDAEKLTDQLRTTASVSAQLMYVQLSFMNRMGSIPWSRKRALLSEVEQNLIQLNVPKEKIDEYKRPFLNIVSFDLYLIFKLAMDEILRRYLNEIEKEIADHTAGKSILGNDEIYAALLEKRRSYGHKKHDFKDVLADSRLADLRGVIDEHLAARTLRNDDVLKLRTISEEVVSLSKECWLAGTVTLQAEEYLNKYSGGTEKRLSEMEK